MAEIGISSIKLFTPAGNDLNELYKNYTSCKTHFIHDKFTGEWIQPLSESNDELSSFISRQSGLKTDYLDRVALLALYCGINGEQINPATDLIVIGSSRGATGLTEKSIADWTQGKKLPLYTSPGTTLGNTASMLAQLLIKNNMSLEHSMTCSTGLQAILNAVAWLRGGLAKNVLAGASEAPLTPYTLSQMRSLKIYAPAESKQEYIQMPFDAHSQGIILSEGSILIELKSWQSGMIKISGWGFDTELQKNPVAANEDNPALINAMQQAIQMTGEKPEVVIAHATGTLKGDRTELNAIRQVLGPEVQITSTKWLTGHSFGLAGLHSVALAILMLERQEFIGLPYQQQPHISPMPLKNILINTLGFGGQVISLILSKR